MLVYMLRNGNGFLCNKSVSVHVRVRVRVCVCIFNVYTDARVT